MCCKSNGFDITAREARKSHGTTRSNRLGCGHLLFMCPGRMPANIRQLQVLFCRGGKRVPTSRIHCPYNRGSAEHRGNGHQNELKRQQQQHRKHHHPQRKQRQREQQRRQTRQPAHAVALGIIPRAPWLSFPFPASQPRKARCRARLPIRTHEERKYVLYLDTHMFIRDTRHLVVVARALVGPCTDNAV